MRPFRAAPTILACFAVAACGAPDAPPSDDAARSLPTIENGVPGLRLVAAASLPRAPDAPAPGANCTDRRDAGSEGARVAHRLGWRVSAEAPLGRYDAVAIYRRASDGTSGSCYIEDGSVVVFDGDAVVAIAFDPDAEAGAPADLGTFAPAAGPRLRLYPGMPGVPLGDLVATGTGLALASFPESEAACGGRLTLPRLFGDDILGARAKLVAAGWQPMAPDVVAAPWVPDDLRARGVVEGECAGTGFAFCGFDYRTAGGARLDVTTIGEDYAVYDYDVTCDT